MCKLIIHVIWEQWNLLLSFIGMCILVALKGEWIKIIGEINERYIIFILITM